MRHEFPEMTGLHAAPHYMRSFAALWNYGPIVQQPAAQMPWGHIMVRSTSSTPPRRPWTMVGPGTC
ncbi:MAG TPA: hypothetical protein VN621_05790 [Arthrobacter sp.]|nr:hypothetical protein [Arthrobacter sp.]